MSLPTFLKDKMGPGRFTQSCLMVSALWFILIYPGIIWLSPDKLPPLMKPTPHYDFYQYYAGAVAVRYGLWDSLYPLPKASVYGPPNHFAPRHRTFLFNPAEASRSLVFYPCVNTPRGSDWSPELKKYFPQAAFYNFIYPPPTALLLWPLSYFSFENAGNLWWPTISIWALFALSFFSSRIHRFLRQRESYTEGLIILACMVFSCLGQTHIPDGNVSPILAALISFACYALMRNRQLPFSCALIPLVLFKSIGLTWLPLLLMNRFYWRSLAYVGVLSIFLNAMVIGLAGPGIYHTFFSLAPKILIPAGFGIVPTLLNGYGFFPRTAYMIFNLIVLGLIYWGCWSNLIKRRPERSSFPPLLLAATLAGTMSLFCLTNYMVWPQYCPCYLFFPFLGWILQEGYLASGSWRYSILGGAALAFCEFITNGVWYLLFGQLAPKWMQFYVLWPLWAFLIPASLLVLALRRLLWERFDFQKQKSAD